MFEYDAVELHTICGCGPLTRPSTPLFAFLDSDEDFDEDDDEKEQKTKKKEHKRSAPRDARRSFRVALGAGLDTRIQ